MAGSLHVIIGGFVADETFLAEQLCAVILRALRPVTHRLAIAPAVGAEQCDLFAVQGAFQRLSNLVGWADKSGTLRELLTGGKKIIISTIFKFSFILDEIGSSLKDKRFAIIIDEAHSSQNGSLSVNLATGISGNATRRF